MRTKMCTKCLKTLPVSEYRKDKSHSDGLSSHCKPCHSAKDAAYRAANKDRISEYGRQWREANRDSIIAARNSRYGRDYDFTRRHGITLDEYEALLNTQDGKCAVCGTDQPGRAGRNGEQRLFAVDHAPASNLIRGLLCHNCNRALGLLRDSPEILEKAISYLRRS